ncbi:long-chain fatty acid transport protein 4 [Leptopilina heterotoma]|uniref:long-chain fatty acid transport protein 4 n=1 Tax=Leptopilina heterotoma TaxID=63436 RepID=UPI001CA978DF|nr:long-chain fatty acid transport protein 4 [Leptopilina heterotoma]
MIEFQTILFTFIAILLGIFILTGSRWRFFYILYRTLPRDLLGAFRFLKINALLWVWETRRLTVARIFTELANEHPEKIAYIFEDKEWTYQELEDFSNRIGRFFRPKRGMKGDSIALVMEGRVEYIGTWLGLSKAGYVTALVNSNLRGDVLIHSIKAAECKAIIYGSELKDAISEIRDKLPDLKLYQWSESSDSPLLEGVVDLNAALDNTEPEPLKVDLELSGPKDKLIYIYTSGTTGMPKAAVVNNLRYMLMTCGVYSMLGLRSTDRIYDSLPLYHTAGGVVGAGQALLRGITVVLRRRFSASKFWSDCAHYECTVGQYIGEICRYLMTVPPSAYDTSHKVRLLFGNGLRPQIWEPFVKRFQIKQIGEFYGATEGNSNLVNIDNRVGAVGFVPKYASALYPVALLRVNEETGELIRGPNGFCIPCKPGEPGVFVGKINPNKAVNDFSGYADKKASEKKIIRDVFKKGDRVFNSGDILVMDELGYFYFKDRTGDTFRWRGENVSTAEIEAVISNVINLKDAVVYGVEVPGNEGKAGMAAIYDPDKSLNLNNLAEGVQKSLPKYARPLFVRVLAQLPMTGTFKLKKKELQQDGFNVKNLQDPIYFLQSSGTYVRLSESLYDDILSEKVRL